MSTTDREPDSGERAPRRRRAELATAFLRGAGFLGDTGAAGTRGAGERFLYQVLVPLLGLTVLSGAAMRLAAEVPATRFAVGLTSAAVAAGTLAVLNRANALPGRRHALQAGGAFVLVGVAGACGGGWLALGILCLLFPLLAWLEARGHVDASALYPPALLVVPAWLLLLPEGAEPGLEGAVPCALALAAAADATRRAHPAAAPALLIPALLLLARMPLHPIGPGLAIAGAALGAWLPIRMPDGFRSNLSRFAVHALTALFATCLAVQLHLPLAPAAVIAALGTGALTAFLNLRTHRSFAVPATVSALLLAFAALVTEPLSELGRGAALLALGIGLQLVAVRTRNGFASRAALLLIVAGALGPLVAALAAASALTGDTLLTGTVAGLALLLFARRVAWVEAEPWWRAFVTPRSAVHVRRGWRASRTAALGLPVVGPVLSLAGRGMGTVSAFLRHDYPVGLPELLTLGAHLYLLTLLQAWIESLAPSAALTVTTEQALVAGLWGVAGLLAFAWGRHRDDAFLRLAGLGYASASLFTAGLAESVETPGESTVLLLVAGAALAGIGVLALAAPGRASRTGATDP